MVSNVNFHVESQQQKQKSVEYFLSNLTIKTRRRSGVFIVNLEHVLHLFLVFLLLNINK